MTARVIQSHQIPRVIPKKALRLGSHSNRSKQTNVSTLEVSRYYSSQSFPSHLLEYSQSTYKFKQVYNPDRISARRLISPQYRTEMYRMRGKNFDVRWGNHRHSDDPAGPAQSAPCELFWVKWTHRNYQSHVNDEVNGTRWDNTLNTMQTIMRSIMQKKEVATVQSSHLRLPLGLEYVFRVSIEKTRVSIKKTSLTYQFRYVKNSGFDMKKLGFL